MTLLDGPPRTPPSLPDFDKGPGGNAFPSWASHLIAFLCGGITFTALIFTPMVAPVLLLVAIVCFVWIASKQRWR